LTDIEPLIRPQSDRRTMPETLVVPDNFVAIIERH